MSWLSSVNNLLENLDGQAETVAETVAEQATSSGISNNLRRLNNTIANNASALTSNIANARNNITSANRVDSFGEEEDYYDDNSFSSFDDDDFGDDEEQTTDEDADELFGANESGMNNDSNPIKESASNQGEQDTVQAPVPTAPIQESEAVSETSPSVGTNQATPAVEKLSVGKAIANAQKMSDLGVPVESSINYEKPKVGTQEQQTILVPNRTPPPGKQQKDETRLLKKQHQQVLASKDDTIQSLESQLTKLREALAKSAAEQEKLNQHTMDLGEKLKASEQEIEAQASELQKAGEQMEKIRTDAKEEREDLQDDHDDEMEDLQRNHQAALDKMRKDYETTIAEWKQRFQSEESLRQQEGGDSIKELQEANKREREALIQLAAVTDERTALQAKLDEVVGQETSLKQQVESSLESAETVAAREQRARDELDKAAAMHAKQMAQRQRREAELEQTILEMGSALTQAKQQLQQQGIILSSPQGKVAKRSVESNETQVDGPNYKEQFEQAAEELETVRVQLTMETQRREALQEQLTEVSKERKQELSLAQSRQHQHDLKVTDLESTIHRLQDSVRALQASSDASSAQIANTPQNVPSSQELEGAKQEIANLSEQLLRQQALAKNAKSEILALKGRLQVANARADDAEKAQYESKYSATPRSRTTYDVEGGGPSRTPPPFSVRRRVKGGSRGVRSIRSVLPCFGSGRQAGGGGIEQVALTIDAIDSWMVDTGSFMRHEPIARLGLLLYLMTLHLWTFALVVFHTTEVEHGDFGSMDSNPRHWREHT